MSSFIFYFQIIHLVLYSSLTFISDIMGDEGLSFTSTNSSLYYQFYWKKMRRKFYKMWRFPFYFRLRMDIQILYSTVKAVLFSHAWYTRTKETSYAVKEAYFRSLTNFNIWVPITENWKSIKKLRTQDISCVILKCNLFFLTTNFFPLKQ